MADSLSREQVEWLRARAERIFLAAVDRDPDRVSETVAEVALEYGHAGIYSVCCVMAQVFTTVAFPSMPPGDGSLEGPMLALTNLRPEHRGDPAALWAARFVVAYANGDRETTKALFFGGLHDEEQSLHNFTALLKMTADIGRQVAGEPD